MAYQMRLMRDLYQRLGLDESSGENEIRAALPAADAAIREAAQFILLDRRRRAVYDRNRRVLATVGKLRARLGLNLTRFWPRARLGDFTAAVSTAGEAPEGGRLPAYAKVAEAQARAGQAEEVFAWAKRLGDPGDRAAAMGGLARGIAPSELTGRR